MYSLTLGKAVPILLLLVIHITAGCRARVSPLTHLEQHFDGKRGQLQVGGPYAGLEFHHSLPLPSRVSFYHPVANSIDLSTDYWQRDKSKPFTAVLTVDGQIDNLGAEPLAYRSTPASVVFEKETNDYRVEMSYRFGEDLPLFVTRFTITNTSSRSVEVALMTGMSTLLRTSHSYSPKSTEDLRFENGGTILKADFHDSETDSATVFVVNAGARPHGSTLELHSLDELPPHAVAVFSYGATLSPNEQLDVIQLIGSSERRESAQTILNAVQSWEKSVTRYENRVSDYALQGEWASAGNEELLRTARWSRALLQANRHYLDGSLVPMPSPAQYNFFFTHDLLVTDLGAVYFDIERVAEDLGYLRNLAGADSVLPHAYYWRDDGYKTEWASSDNWNHLWFVLLCSSYLKHSSDAASIESLLPMIRHSMQVVLENEREGLMYAERPDWWDIGHVYGARSYLTILTTRALRAYAYLMIELDREETRTAEYVELAEVLNQNLIQTLWDEERGYLMNDLVAGEVDEHYYSGSLLAAAFDQLDDEKSARLLATAKDILVDKEIGVRNAMPPDFHERAEQYQFEVTEVGQPYAYMNGGVWPQGIAWYALGLLSSDQPNEALDAVREYLTLGGITDSPNGQPAFFEYRSADAESPDYGRIDKTTFLWAGGWFMNVLYGLAGARENEWNLYFAPDHPQDFREVRYDLMVQGRRCRVVWSGSGRYLAQIEVDGRKAHSAVVTGPASEIRLMRGLPLEPYLSNATAVVDGVRFEAETNELSVSVKGISGQPAYLQVVAPTTVKRVVENGRNRSDSMTQEMAAASVQIVALQWIMESSASSVVFAFE